MPTQIDVSHYLDLDHLLMLRLLVARVGELGLAGWWGTKDVLGAMGAMTYRRGFPRSQEWARAKVVFEVARARCAERFPNSGVITLWNLPPMVEEQFEHAWGKWIGDEETWPSFFNKLQAWDSPSLVDALTDFGLWTIEMKSFLSSCSPTKASVEVPAAKELDRKHLGLLAAGFAKGASGEPVVPFLRLLGD